MSSLRIEISPWNFSILSIKFITRTCSLFWSSTLGRSTIDDEIVRYAGFDSNLLCRRRRAVSLRMPTAAGTTSRLVLLPYFLSRISLANLSGSKATTCKPLFRNFEVILPTFAPQSNAKLPAGDDLIASSKRRDAKSLRRFLWMRVRDHKNW